MRTTLLFLSVFLSFCLIVSCEKDEEPTPVDDIVGTWDYLFTMVNDSISPSIICDSIEHFTFHNNGNYNLIYDTDTNSTGECIALTQAGRWTYDALKDHYTISNAPINQNERFIIVEDTLFWNLTIPLAAIGDTSHIKYSYIRRD